MAIAAAAVNQFQTVTQVVDTSLSEVYEAPVGFVGVVSYTYIDITPPLAVLHRCTKAASAVVSFSCTLNTASKLLDCPMPTRPEESIAILVGVPEAV